MKNSNRRVTEILLLDEDEVGNQNLAFDEKTEKMISCENLDCAYPKSEKLALKGLNFKLCSNDLLAVIGSVGSGKSTIFNLILNDLDLRAGKFGNNMSISLATQEPWIFEGTLKDNILLGKELDQKRYEEVLRVRDGN